MVTFNGAALTIDPVLDLSANATYTAAIPAGALKNLVGNPMVHERVFWFSTPDTIPPVVSSTDPADGATGLPLNQVITVRFSENVLQGPSFGDISVNGAPAGSSGYSVTLVGISLTLTPATAFPYSTPYTVTVPAGAVGDQAGNTLAEPYGFSFVTVPDTTPPAVVSTDPANGATGLWLTPAITVTFDEPVVEGTNYTGVELATGGAAVPASKSLSGKVLTLTAPSKLRPGASYTVTLPAGAVKDAAGNETAAAYVFGFTTVSADVQALPFAVSDAVLDPDRPVVYLTSRAEGRVYALDYATGQLSFLGLGAEPDSLELGLGQYAGELYVGVHCPDPNPGLIEVIDRQSFTVRDTMGLAIDPYDVVAGRDGHLYVTSGRDQWTEFDSYDRATKALESQAVIYQRAYAKLHPTLERIYSIDTALSPRIYTAYGVSGGVFTDRYFPPYYNSTLKAEYAIDPTGKYLWNGSGDLFSCHADKARDMIHVTKLGTAFSAIAFEPDLSRFYTTPLSSQAINVYRGSDFGSVCSYGLADNPGKHLLKRGDDLVALLVPASPTPAYRAGVQVVRLTPVVVGSSPPEGDASVLVTVGISVTFSETVTAGAQSGAISLADGSGNPVPTVTSLNGSTLTVQSAADLAFSTHYTLTVPADAVIGTRGIGMAGDWTLRFTTRDPDVAPPTVASTDPAGAATGVAVTKAVRVTFDEAVWEGTSYGGIQVRASGGSGVAVAKSVGGTVLTLTPEVRLAMGATRSPSRPGR